VIFCCLFQYPKWLKKCLIFVGTTNPLEERDAPLAGYHQQLVGGHIFGAWSHDEDLTSNRGRGND